ncbi:hypothetical protein GCM10011488_36060 [Steroidobacter agaridevorans]|nr:hypothetical protein GCM10011488_36060 [Steroidobacter agaridevorans]
MEEGMNYFTRLLYLLLALVATPQVLAQTSMSAQDYAFIGVEYKPTPSLLYIGRDASKLSGTAALDNGFLTENVIYSRQSWASNYLGLQWSLEVYNFIYADFDGKNGPDILMQSKAGGASYLLLADSNQNFTGASQSFANPAFGLDWSEAKHKIIPGDFNGDGRADLFFQATSAAGDSAILFAASSGAPFSSSAWVYSWSDNGNPVEGLNWSTQAAVVHAADFNGDQKTDFFVQAKPKFVTIDFDVPFPVPTYPAEMSGIVLSYSTGSAPVFATADLLSRHERGVDWSPNNANVIVGYFNGDNRADILLQARRSGGTTYLLTTDGNTQLTNGVAMPGSQWSSTSSQLIPMGFPNGSGYSSGLIFQTLDAGGINQQATSIAAGVSPSFQRMYDTTGTYPGMAGVRLGGQPNISIDGEAQYTIPLDLPAGINGVAPRLAISYNHNSKAGQLGPRWDITGLSNITRCPKTFAQDGVTTGMTLTANDAYCLDGRRLRHVSGPYAQTNSTYRTEIETYSLVKVTGHNSYGPTAFEVRGKDGYIYEYGNTEQSRIATTLGGATITNTWALNRVSDRAGNAMEVTYDIESGHAYPARITYGGNQSRGIQPQVWIEFNDDPTLGSDLPPSDVSWWFGGLAKYHYYLTSIHISIEGSQQSLPWRTYNFQYATRGNGPDGRPLLSSIQECVYSGYESRLGCGSPTSVEWNVSSKGWGQTDASYSSGPWEAGVAGDINGDGYEDTYYVEMTGPTEWGDYSRFLRVRWGSATGPGASELVLPTDYGSGGLMFLPTDLDSDGRTDLLIMNYGTWYWLRYHNGAFVFTDTGVPTSGAIPSGPWGIWEMTDVDGDGYEDLVNIGANQNQLRIRYHNHDGSAGFEGGTTTYNVGFNMVRIGAGQSMRAFGGIDVDGNGRGDLIAQASATNYTARVLYSTTSGFTVGETLNSVAVDIDANSDHCTDLVSNTQLWISKCMLSGASALNAPVTVPGLYATPLIHDWDGDGFEDRLYSNGGTLFVSRSTGTSFEQPVSTGVPYYGDQPVNATVLDMDGNGRRDIIYLDTGGQLRHQSNPNGRSELVTAITDGFGNFARFNYKSTAAGNCYTGSSTPPAANTHLRAVSIGMLVACGVEISDGNGSSYNLSFAYENARLNVQRRDFAGFSRRTVTDSRNSVATRVDLHQQFPYRGMVSSSRVSQGGSIVSETTNSPTSLTYSSPTTGQQTSYPYVWQAVTNLREVTGVLANSVVARKTITVGLDSYGNPTSTSMSLLDLQTDSPLYNVTLSRSTAETIHNDAATWCLGRSNRTTFTESLGSSSRSHVTSRTVDYAACRVEDETIEPDSVATAAERLFIDYTYDPEDCGNLSSVRVDGLYADGTAMPSRTTQIGYNTASCRFPTSVTNPLNQTESFGFDDLLGVPRTHTDANQLQTVWDYDAFGRLKSETRPDQTSTHITYGSCANGQCGVTGARWQQTTAERDRDGLEIVRRMQALDSFDRPIFEQAQRATGPSSGSLSNVRKTYDAFGRLSTESVPYSAGGNGAQRYLYDLLGRVTRSELLRADNTIDRYTELTYAGHKVSIRNPRGHTTQRFFDLFGQLRKVVDPSPGGTTEYSYSFDSAGLLATSAIDNAGNVLTSKTNRRGFKLEQSDPDAGVWQYRYTSFGELTRQIDAKNQQVDFTYDPLSRMKTRTEPETPGVLTQWNWGASAAFKNIGQMESVTAAGGYIESYTYDGYGRPNHVTYNYGADGSYDIDVGYNAAGLLDTLTYPASSGANRFRAKYSYLYGQQVQVKDDYANTTLWTLANTNDRGQVTQETFGNGQQIVTGFDALTGLVSSVSSGVAGSTTNRQNLSYQWDPNGNLESRTDLNRSNLNETFTYDALDRLQNVYRLGVQTLSLSVNAIGNITQKSDFSASTYDYSTAQAGCNYYSHSQPHAVRRVGTASYCYDQNGNMTSRAGSAISWTSFNMPNVINGSGGASSTFTYAPDRSRRKQVATYSGGGETTIYVAGLFEKVTSGTTTYFRHHVAAGRGTVIHSRLANGTSQNYYVSPDHLGSSSLITDASGNVIVDQSFDAFGKRRSADWLSALTTSELQSMANATRHGFTGHEHLDNLGLIHMNGRVQDPGLGRFISADPFIFSPGSSQGLNRYSYVGNNPLSMIDPSGFAEVCVSTDVEVTVCAPGFNDQPVNSAIFGGGGGGGGDGMSAGQAAAAILETVVVHANVKLTNVSAYSIAADGRMSSVTVTELGWIDRPAPRSSNPFTRFGEPGSFAASGAYEFVSDPDISDQAKVSTAAVALTVATLGLTAELMPLAAAPLAFGLEVQGIADGMPARFGPRIVFPRGPGAATGPIPPGHTSVSRWASAEEAEIWIANGGTAIPAGIGAEGRVYVTAFGAAKPGGTDAVRIDFAIDSRALLGAGKPEWFQILQPMQRVPIYNMSVTYPP